MAWRPSSEFDAQVTEGAAETNTGLLFSYTPDLTRMPGVDVHQGQLWMGTPVPAAVSKVDHVAQGTPNSSKALALVGSNSVFG